MQDKEKQGDAVAELAVDFCGEWYEPSPDGVFSIGREGDLEIDDNP